MSRIVKGSGGARVIDGAVYDAKTEASRIVADAHAEAEQIKEQARDEGRAEGRADVAGLLARARQQVDRRIVSAEDDIRTLAVRIAERVVRRQIELQPEVVVDIAKAALADARGRHDFVMRVHPDDVGLLEKEKPGLLARLSVSAHILIRSDESIERGGLRIKARWNGPEVGLRPTPFAPIIRPAPPSQRVKSSRLRITGRYVCELPAEPPRHQIDLPESSLQGCIPSDRIPAGGFL